jgi:3-oxoacyl-[acyl-carrier-protein] synthase-3
MERMILKLTKNLLLLPSSTLDIRELLENSNRSESEITKTISTTGISKLSYAHPKLFSDFIFEGLSKIREKYINFFNNVDAIIVVSQTYDQRIPSISSRIQDKFNLAESTFCIDVYDGCAGYIKALSIAKMLEIQGHSKILIVSGDLSSTITSKAELSTKVLFGDGISVSVLERDESIIETRLFNVGDNKNVISCSTHDNLMHMNGFEVFRFTRNYVPQLIKTFTSESKNSLESYDLIALHQASKLVVTSIFQSLGYQNRFTEDFNCGEIGNLQSGSIGAWLSNIEDLVLFQDLKMLAVGYGAGLSWGLASIMVNLQTNERVYV